jgi:hypothetical protein
MRSFVRSALPPSERRSVLKRGARPLSPLDVLDVPAIDRASTSRRSDGVAKPIMRAFAARVSASGRLSLGRLVGFFEPIPLVGATLGAIVVA